MRGSGIRLGPLALFFVVVFICVETLGILSIATASADLRVAKRYADTVTVRYGLESRGQMFLKEADEAARSGKGISGMPDTRTDEAGVTWKEIWENDYKLTVGLQADEDGKITIVCWRMNRPWEPEADMELWDGK